MCYFTIHTVDVVHCDACDSGAGRLESLTLALSTDYLTRHSQDPMQVFLNGSAVSPLVADLDFLVQVSDEAGRIGFASRVESAIRNAAFPFCVLTQLSSYL